MASNDYDRPMAERPLDMPPSPHAENEHAPWSSPLGMALAIVFIVLTLSAILG